MPFELRSNYWPGMGGCAECGGDSPPRLGSIRNGETDYRASRAPATTLCCDTREWTMRVHGEDLIHAKAARHDPKRFNYFAKKDGISPE